MSRPYFNSAHIEVLVADLSERELSILQTLDRVRLATGSMLQRLHFTSDTARHRRRVLQSLTDRRLICRLDRLVGGRRAGSSGYLFALHIAGQHVLERVTQRPVRRPTTPGVRFVQHVLGVSSIYEGLVLAERRGLIKLLDFEAEPAAWRRFPAPGGGTAILKPDAYVRIETDSWIEAWWIEFDQATESPSTLARKGDAYRAYYNSGKEQHRLGFFPQVLWCVPDERRYGAVVDVCGRQPAETWKLHRVTLSSDAVGLMTGATP